MEQFYKPRHDSFILIHSLTILRWWVCYKLGLPHLGFSMIIVFNYILWRIDDQNKVHNFNQQKTLDEVFLKRQRTSPTHFPEHQNFMFAFINPSLRVDVKLHEVKLADKFSKTEIGRLRRTCLQNTPAKYPNAELVRRGVLDIEMSWLKFRPFSGVLYMSTLLV